MVIPHSRAGYLRVTHPFATFRASEDTPHVRLACVRHAASVHPEPGSNSPSSLLSSTPRLMRLPHQPKDAYLNRTFRPVFSSRLPSKLALARLGSIRCLATLQLLMCRLNQLLFCIACIHLEPFVLLCLRRGKYIIYTSLHALSNHLALYFTFFLCFSPDARRLYIR